MASTRIETINGKYILLSNVNTGHATPFVHLDVHYGDSEKVPSLNNVSNAEAHALANWIKTNVPVPTKPTFKEHFDALPVGAWFDLDSDKLSRIKTSSEGYFILNREGNGGSHQGLGLIGHRTDLTITQINPEEVAQ